MVEDRTGQVPDAVSRAAAAVQRAFGRGSFRGAAVLGSGFGALVEDALRVPYVELEGFPDCGVSGHAGEVALMGRDGDDVLVFSGRVHAYESVRLEDVTFAVELAGALGVSRLLLTCAAGGVREDLVAGNLVLVTDHLNLAGWTPSIAPHDFLELGDVYSSAWRQELMSRARGHECDLSRGVLACVRGPAYETPAEVRMLRALGADLVCMSTVPEAIRARALGLEVAALAAVANPAAGLSDAPLRHTDVLARVRETVSAHAEFLTGAIGSAVESR